MLLLFIKKVNVKLPSFFAPYLLDCTYTGNIYLYYYAKFGYHFQIIMIMMDDGRDIRVKTAKKSE